MKTKIVLFIMLAVTGLAVCSEQADTVEHVAVVEISSSSAPSPAIVQAIKPAKPLVQMAILLDTSSSMEGLIEQAKTELWSIVNEFIFAKRNGMEPELQVALYEYGKSSLDSKDGYIRQIVPFLTDLDKISEELFALKTNGGQEYCGWVIQEAAKSLKWSDSFNDLKVIFIAGNEPFTQGQVDYNKACKEAIAKGIIVNTIHCGTESEGINGHWKDGAVLADGSFLNIDQNRKVARINAPQDKEIAELSIKLNGTYIAYGGMGGMGFGNQALQDKNAASISHESAVQRSVTKSSFNYRNSEWDLVDALKDNKVNLESMKEDELPENMQKMTVEERKAYADAKATERVTIQKRIQELNIQREAFIKTEMQKQAASQTASGGVGNRGSLGSAVTSTVRQQAMRKNFSFEQPVVTPPGGQGAGSSN
ncbi:MAG: VWA domain-containing protein [Sedimentisphaerales bacterium]|nr:VWA domain-containing protein [Sedimentisphaerales bacterium]